MVNYKELTVQELKKICKSKGMKGYSKKSKKDLIKMCKKNGDPQSKLLPIMNPMFNLRELSIQIVLLEDHLFQKRKRCKDCICKHFLTMEGLAEEAITLDKEGKLVKKLKLQKLPERIRKIERKHLNGEDSEVIAQELRALRKSFMRESFPHFTTEK